MLAVKSAFGKARTLIKDEKLALELEKAIEDSDAANVKSLLGEGKENNYLILAFINIMKVLKPSS